MRIRVDPESLRSLGSSFRGEVGRFQDIRDRLTGEMNALDWEAKAEAQVVGRWDQARTSSLYLGSNTSNLSVSLTNAASAFLTADSELSETVNEVFLAAMGGGAMAGVAPALAVSEARKLETQWENDQPGMENRSEDPLADSPEIAGHVATAGTGEIAVGEANITHPDINVNADLEGASGEGVIASQTGLDGLAPVRWVRAVVEAGNWSDAPYWIFGILIGAVAPGGFITGELAALAVKEIDETYIIGTYRFSYTAEEVEESINRMLRDRVGQIEC